MDSNCHGFRFASEKELLEIVNQMDVCLNTNQSF